MPHAQIDPARRPLATRIAAAIATITVAFATVLVAAPANAVIASPTTAKTAAGTTSIPATSGKASGSGLWGFVGDLAVRTSGNVFPYGIAISPTDGSIWVTDSGKITYGAAAVAGCTFLGGTLVATSATTNACQLGTPSVLHYASIGSNWAAGQYQVNGGYATAAAGTNKGIGVNYEPLSAADDYNGTTFSVGRFGGPRAITVDQAGNVVIVDPDALVPWPGSQPGVVLDPYGAELSAFGNQTPTNPFTAPFDFNYPVAAATLLNGNVVVTNQYAYGLKEYSVDPSTGVLTFVRNISTRRPVDTACAGDNGAHAPYGVGVDPTTSDILVNVLENSAGRCTSFIERIDATTGALIAIIGQGVFAPATNGYAVEVDPITGDIYASQESGQGYVFSASGAFLGRFSAFNTTGSNTGNGQIPTATSAGIRDIAFDANGFMYLTTGQGTAAARVQIFARTPDPVTSASGTYLCAVDSLGAPTGQIDRTRASLTWDALPTDVTADAQSPLRDFVVERSIDGGTTWSLVSTPVGTVPAESIAGLDPASSPQFRISAWNEAGNGDTALIASIATPDCALPPGTVTISKVVSGPGDPSATFDFTLECTLAGAPVALDPADAAFALTAGGNRTVTVPAGAQCTVVETMTGGFTAAYVDSDGDPSDGVVSVSTATGASVEVTNTFPMPLVGTLVVDKVVTGAGAPAGDSFTFGLECSLAGEVVPLAAADTAFSLVAGGSRTVTGIPEGADCAVSEAAATNYTTAYSSSGGTTDGTETIEAGATSTVTVTNDYSAPPACVADAESISVVYSTQNDADAALDGSTVVEDRVSTGRDDMQLVYTIEKPCVTYPVPVIEYTGDWTVSDPASGTYAQFDFVFGAVDAAIESTYASQLAAMNLLVQTSPDCQDRSITNFEACVRPIILTWGGSIPVGITGTVTVSVAATTPGTGSLHFFLEQAQTGEQLSPTGDTPYVVTRPVLAVTAVGEFCSATLAPYELDGMAYTPTGAEPTPFSATASVTDDGIAPDDATPIPVDLAGLGFEVDGALFPTVAALEAHLRALPAGDYSVIAHYVAPDGVAAVDPNPIVVTVLGADAAPCYTAAALPGSSTPAVMQSTGSELPIAAIAAGSLAALSGIVLLARRRDRGSRQTR